MIREHGGILIVGNQQMEGLSSAQNLGMLPNGGRDRAAEAQNYPAGPAILRTDTRLLRGHKGYPRAGNVPRENPWPRSLPLPGHQTRYNIASSQKDPDHSI